MVVVLHGESAGTHNVANHVDESCFLHKNRISGRDLRIVELTLDAVLAEILTSSGSLG